MTPRKIGEVDKNGNEFWFARVLGKLLGYRDFRNFSNVIDKAKEACENSGQSISEHIVEVNEQLKFAQGAEQSFASFALSCYACYLIVQNADPSKPIVANGQTYFAIQTRRQELQDDEAFTQLKEDDYIVQLLVAQLEKIKVPLVVALFNEALIQVYRLLT